MAVDQKGNKFFSCFVLWTGKFHVDGAMMLENNQREMKLFISDSFFAFHFEEGARVAINGASDDQIVVFFVGCVPSTILFFYLLYFFL